MSAEPKSACETSAILRRDAEAAHMARAGDRHVGDLLGARVRLHMGVGEEVGALRGDDERERRDLVGAGRQADDVVDVLEPCWKRPSSPQMSASASPAPHGERADHGGVGAHQRPGGVRRDAPPAGDLDIGRDVVAVARIVLRVDELEIAPGCDREAEALEARLDHARAARSGSGGAIPSSTMTCAARRTRSSSPSA